MMKRISFVGRSLNDLKQFPEDAKHEAGFQLDKVQRGLEPSDWKPIKTVGNRCNRNPHQRRSRHLSCSLCCKICRYGICFTCF